MKKEVKIIKKVKHLLKRLGCPRWLHHFGPKIYEFYEHLMPLLVRHFCKGLSYRKIVSLFDLFGFNCPSKSALQYTAKKIEVDLWNRILELTSGIRHHIIALDGTGFSVTNPSYHYLRRIDGKIPKTYGRRNMVEAGFSSLKRKFGSSVNSKTARTIRAEVYGKMVCHNLFSYFIRVLGQSRVKIQEINT